MINSTLSNVLMPRLVTATATTPLAIGYTFAVHQLALCKLATNHFLGAIIDKNIGTMLEYQHLVENPAMKSVWEMSFANKIGRLFQGIQNLKGMDTCFFIAKLLIPTNKWTSTAGLSVSFAPKRRNRIAPA